MFSRSVTKISAPVIIDATFHQDQHFKLNQTLTDTGIGVVVKNFSSGKVVFGQDSSTNGDFKPVQVKGPYAFSDFQGNPFSFWNCLSSLGVCGVSR